MSDKSQHHMTETFSSPSEAIGAALEAVTVEGERVYISKCYVVSTVAPRTGEYVTVTPGGVLARVEVTDTATAIRSVSATQAINILK